ncbi:hypothetical protein F5Y04DRAFT_293150 [Hypomontagnella monticulosa]|nr:hypothetical protein F5Y04DRAFT_293150 [Hypomontagnella monticulosa]
MSSSLRKCEVCESNVNLFRCSNCQTTWYCGREHQQAHRSLHENECNATRDNEGTARREKSLWEENSEAFQLEEPDADNFKFLFFSTAKERPDLEDRSGVVEAILENFFPGDVWLAPADEINGYVASIAWALDAKFPYLLLEQNEYQKCYDFMKWWHTPELHGIHSNRGVILPHLELTGADLFEPCDIFIDEHPSLGQVSALMLLKIRLLTDLQVLQIVPEIAARKLPQEIVDMIYWMVLNFPSMLARPGIMNTPNLTALTNDLNTQILMMYDCIKESCPAFWATLPHPNKRPITKLADWNTDIDEEMRHIASYAYESWVETPAALDVVRTMAKNDKGSE